MAEVKLQAVSHIYPGSSTPAVKNLSLTALDGEFLVLVGPSGCGKTTALRMVAGLEEVHEGQIIIGPRDVTRLQPKARDVAMVFQNYALYPHMTVRRNIAYALRVAGLGKAEINKRVADAAKMLGLEELLDRKPSELSGGQRQRVAMGRATVRVPQVFLMDEPLSNLDAKLRNQTRGEITQLQQRLRTTTIYVTHDQVEAMTMGDRVAVMSDGELQQIGPPKEVYNRPANTFVATFVGAPAMAIVTCSVDAGAVRLGAASIPASARLGSSGEATVIVGVRAEDWRYASASDGVKVLVNQVEDLGADTYIRGTAGEGAEAFSITASRLGPSIPRSGEMIHLAPDPTRVHLFSPRTGARLGD